MNKTQRPAPTPKLVLKATSTLRSPSRTSAKNKKTSLRTIPTQINKRGSVSFHEDAFQSVRNTRFAKRHPTVQPTKRRANANSSIDVDTSHLSSTRNELFPLNVPEFPKQPNLQTKERERERREIIYSILQDVLRYNKNDWTDDAMRNQPSMFDEKDVSSKNKLWYRLAMNLLYAGKNKNVVPMVQEAPKPGQSELKSQITLRTLNSALVSTSSKATTSKRSNMKPRPSKRNELEADSKATAEEINQAGGFSPISRRNTILAAM